MRIRKGRPLNADRDLDDILQSASTVYQFLVMKTRARGYKSVLMTAEVVYITAADSLIQRAAAFYARDIVRFSLRRDSGSSQSSCETFVKKIFVRSRENKASTSNLRRAGAGTLFKSHLLKNLRVCARFHLFSNITFGDLRTWIVLLTSQSSGLKCGRISPSALRGSVPFIYLFFCFLCCCFVFCFFFLMHVGPELLSLMEALLYAAPAARSIKMDPFNAMCYKIYFNCLQRRFYDEEEAALCVVADGIVFFSRVAFYHIILKKSLDSDVNTCIMSESYGLSIIYTYI